MRKELFCNVLRFLSSFLIVVFGLAENSYAQNTLDLTGLDATAPSTAAYSIRRLSTTYTGNLIKVRRSTDNATQDITYNAGNTLDTVSLKTFIGSASGYIDTWYDQSGNARNQTQATAALQPRIVNAGVIDRQNNVPAVYFNGSSYTLSAAFTGLSAGFTTCIVGGVVSNTANSSFGGKTSSNQPNPFDFYNSTLIVGNGASPSSQSLTNGIASTSGYSQWTFGADATQMVAYRFRVNNISATTAPTNYADASLPLYLGSRQDNATSLNGYIGEYLLFPVVLSSGNRGIVECRQMNDFRMFEIVGNTTLSPGRTTPLSSAITGGTWISSATGVATIGSATGLISGVATGTARITYTLPTGCTRSTVITVNVPADGLRLDGANDYVQATNQFVIGTSDFSIEAWVKPSTVATAAQIIVGQDISGNVNHQFRLALSTNNISFALSDTGSANTAGFTSTTAPFVANVWTHVAVVRSGTNHSIYINGILTGTVTSTVVINNLSGSDGTKPLKIGSRGTTGTASNPFNGVIDEVRFWTVARTQAEIQANMGCNIPQQTGLRYYYRFDEGIADGTNTSLTSVLDYSGNSNCGTLVNMALTGTASNFDTGAVADCNPITISTPAAITGASVVCTGYTATLANTATGGIWTSSSARATVGSTTGIVTGVTAGTAVITYSLNCQIAIRTLTINASPLSITGANICIGTPTLYSNGTAGGTWISGNLGVVTIGSATGIATGVSAGTSVITYQLTATGCYSTTLIAVNTAPAAITGTTEICMFRSRTLSNATSDGIWTSASTGVATIGSTTGITTSVSAGTSVITYRLTATQCYDTVLVTINPNPGAVTGANSCIGAPSLYSNVTPGGTWSSSDLGVVTIGSSTGIATGVSAGTSVISYQLTTTGCYNTTVVMVNTPPAAITGNTLLSTTITTLLADATGGGTWSSSATGVATVGTTGLVAGVSVGTSLISYTLSTGCRVTTTVTVKAASTGLIQDGVNDYVSAPAGVYFNGNLTIEAWVYPITSFTNYGRIVDFGVGELNDNVILTSSFGTSGLPTFYIFYGTSSEVSVTSTQQLTLNAWNHVAATLNGTTGTIYVNGVAAGTATFATPPTNVNRTKCYIGRSNWTGDPYPNQKLDEVRIWNIARTEAQIKADMYCNIPQQTGLIAYYRFDEGIASGTNTGQPKTMDYSGNGLCGILNNFSLTGTSSNFVTGAVGNCNTISISTPAAITGATNICGVSGATIMLANTATGGEWSSSATGVATVGSTGIVTSVAAGTAVITYSLNCQIAIKVVTVNPLPAAITGSTTLSPDITATLANATSGGRWSSSAVGVATIGSTTGIVRGVAAGTAMISYALTTGCYTSAIVTVNTPADGLRLDGTNDYVQANNPFAIGTSDFSVEAWVKPANLSGDNMIISEDNVPTGNNFRIYFHNANLYALLNDASNSNSASFLGSQTIVANTWMHIAMVRSGASCLFYINGVLTGSAAATLGTTINNTSWSDTTRPLRIGARNGTSPGSDQFEGLIDEVRIWTVARTQAEIQANMSCNIPQQAGLRYYYRFDEGIADADNTSLTRIMDYSGNGNCGTMVNMARTGTTSNFDTGAVSDCNAITLTNPSAIAGTAVVCLSNTTTLTNTSSGGIWTSGSVRATVGSTTGIVTGVTAGTAVITYSLNCEIATIVVTVNPIPASITGSNLCLGSTTTLSNATGGGTWISSAAGVANIGSATGVVSGVSAGTSVITYQLTATGCYSTTVITVNPLPTAITGAVVVCPATTTTLSNATSGGTWSSSNTGVATVGSTTGLYSGVANGTAIITYKVSSSGCYATVATSVRPMPTVNSLSNVAYCNSQTAASISLTGPVSGTTFLWSNSNTAIGLVGSSSGRVCGTSGEGGNVILTAPAGAVFTSVNFASYGTPSGTCGSYTIGSCHASNSLSLVQSYLIGNNSATIPATNDAFGSDPCGGTYKNLYVQATYSYVAIVPSFTVTNTGASPISGTVSVTPVANGCTGTVASYTVTANPNPAAIGGTTIACQGATTTLTNATGGGTWNSSATGVATIGSASGIATGVGAGTSVITYQISATGCYSTKVVTVNPTPASITGSNICIGTPTTYTSATSGGTWISSATGVATIGSATGIATGVSAGTSMITYRLTATGCYTTTVVRVNTAPAVITGTTGVCQAATTTLADATGGGTWSSNALSVATIGSTTGTATGVSAGTTVITYLVTSTQCYATTVLTINPTPASITGTNICIGTPATYTSATSGGTWISSATGVATIGSTTGIATGVSAGTSMITYRLTATGCYTTTVVRVNTAPAVITGTTGVCQAATTTLADATGGGTWSSNALSVATIGSTTGTATGVSAGTAVITYQVIATLCYATTILTVNPTPAPITGSNICIGTPATYTSATSGGAWTSSATGVATIGSTTGIASGVSAGTTVITYRLSATGCYTTTVVTVNPLPASITGSNVCVGSTTNYNNTTSGGTWISSATGVATIGSTTGVAIGVSTGTTVITYQLSATGCYTTTVVTVNPLPASITGSDVCVGSTTTYNNITGGGTWSSSATGVATIGSTTGVATGVSAGTTVITYQLSATGCYTTTVVTVNQLPASITGSNVCVGSTTTYNNTTSGGTWISSATGVATIGSTTGVATGISAGTTVITYQLSATGCYTTTVVTVNPLPASITGSNVCVGSTSTYNNTTGGGTWISSATGVATIGSATGVATGVSTGTTVITYQLSATGCYTTTVVTVNPLPASITGSDVCVGSTTTYSNTTGGGTWSSSATGVATIGSTTGVVTGVSSGTTVITYQLSATGCYTTTVVTINPLPASITGSDVCVGSNTTYNNSTGGGTWISSATGVATIGSATGVATGVSAGTTVITYQLSATGCYTTTVIAVNSLPASITGTNVCVGSTTTYNNTTSGGTWISSATGVATIGSTTGIATGVSAGTTVITYQLSATGCYTTTVVTVNTEVAAITGTTGVCIGATTTLANTTGGGTWTSDAPAVAAIGSTTGVASGVSAGTAVITYLVTATQCYATTVLTVNPLPAAITGNTTLSTTITTLLADATSGGIWVSSATAVATVGTTGLVTGVSSGTSVISYTLPAGCRTTTVVTVNTASVGMNFDGTDDGIGLSNDVDVQIGTGTIEAWIKTSNAGSSYRAIIAKPFAYSIFLLDNVLVVHDWGSGGLRSTGINLADNKWHHVASSFNSGVTNGSYIYLDGVQVLNFTYTVANQVNELTIGRDGSYGQNFTGNIDEARIWNVQRTGAEIAANMNCNIPQQAGLIGYYRFDEGIAGGTNTGRSSVIDYSGNNRCGTIANIALTGGVSNFVTGAVGDCNAISITGPAAITGTTYMCNTTGATATLANTVAGGTWSSSAPGVATVGSTGVVSRVSVGTTVITYSLNCQIATTVFTVNPLPASITGSNVCIGSTTTYSNSTGGGTWSSSATGVATIGSATGIATGVSVGTTVITYQLSATGCYTTTVVTVNPLPASVTGSNVCVGSTTTYNNITGGGTWSSSATGVATIGSVSGVATGVSAGTTVITYRLSATGCYTTTVVTVNPLPASITGSNVCIGSTTTYSNSTGGGTWSSSATGVATIGSTTGITTGVSVGTTVITYQLSATGCYTTTVVSVNTLSGSILASNICVGSNVTCSCSTSGGTWISSSTGIATIGSSTGVATGVSAGTSVITYRLTSTGCYTTTVIGVNSLPASITGTNVCVGSTTTYSNSTSGGTWSSSATGVATIGSTTGVATGVSAGTTVITYQLSSTGCYTTTVVTVNASPNIVVGGSTVIYAGSSTSLTATGGVSYTWSPGTGLSATTGTSISANPSTTTSYTVTGISSAGCANTAIVTVSVVPVPTLSGSAACTGSLLTVTSSAQPSQIVWQLAGAGIYTVTPTSVSTGTTVAPTTNMGVYVDASGNIFVADNSNHRIQKWAPGATSGTTVAGTGSAGSAANQLNHPTSVFVDASANIFVLDNNNHRVQKWAPGATSGTTVAGTGAYGSGPTTLGSPQGVYVDASGNIYVADRANHRIQKWALGATLGTTVAGTGASGSGANQLNSPYGVYVDLSGNIYVADLGNHRIQKWAPGATLGTTVAGTGTLGSGANELNLPAGVWVDGSGYVYVAERGNHRIQKWAPGATSGTTVGGTGVSGSGANELNNPYGVVVDASGNIYVADNGNSRIQRFGISIDQTYTAATAGNYTAVVTTGAGAVTTNTVTVNPLPASITGSNICLGAPTAYSCATSGGTWISSATGVATIGSASGTATGVSVGTTVITYQLSSTGCYTTTVVRVNAAVAAITGTTGVCLGATTTLTNATGGGAWSSSATGVATVGSSTGLSTSVSAGTAVITYLVTASQCYATTVLTVNPTPASITGSNVCVGSTTTYSNTTSGGTWSSSATGVATIGSATGIATGVSAGTTVITYQLSATGCYTTTVVSVNPLSGSVTASNICIGSNATYSCSTSGGTWSSSATGVATIGSSTGVANGVSAGTAVITYRLTSTGCFTTTVIAVNPLPASVTGANVCVGSATTYSNVTGGGTWISSTTGVVTVGSADGIVSGVSSGIAVITYQLSSTGCYTSKALTVNALPASITGSNVCVGSTITYNNTTSGGTWSSSSIGIATIGSTSGIATGVSAGTTVITYRLSSTGCYTTTVVAVNSLPSTITGTAVVCPLLSATLSNTTSGGVWSSSATGIATVGTSTGIVTGVASGTSVITYTLASGCIASKVVTVNPTPAAITGTTTACVGLTSTLRSTTPSGNWSSSATGIASVVTLTGVVTGVSAGTATITYTRSNSCYTTATFTVNPLPAAISGVTTACAGYTTTLTNATGGGAWSSSATGVASVGSATGVVSAIAAGSATITYAIATGCIATTGFTVNALPATIFGTAKACEGFTSTLTNTVTGGAWSSGSTAIATVASTTGVVTAVTAGTTTITYSRSNGCYATKEYTVNAMPASIGGTPSTCIGLSSTLTNATSGGAWSTSAPTFAPVVTGTGTVTGVVATTATISYTIANGCFTTRGFTVNAIPAAIGGTKTACEGFGTTLTNSVSGGTWSSANTAVATVGSTSGFVTGITAGTTTITYMRSNGCIATTVYTVNATPAPIAGTLRSCIGFTSTLTNATGGGTWTSANTGVASAGASTGVITGITSGTTNITYRLTSTGCYATASYTVSANPASITGSGNVCTGSTITLADATSGGAWTVSNANASMGTGSGMVTGVSAGTAVVSYTLSTGCYKTTTINVLSAPSAIGGISSICAGGATTLSNSVSGGAWTSSNTAVATVGSASGVVTGTAGGTARITYTVGGACYTTFTTTVGAILPITGNPSACTGSNSPLSCGSAGGTWSSSNTAVATIGSTGIITGVSAGSSIVTYALPSGCARYVTVYISDAGSSISGLSSVCVGQTITLSNTTAPGGAWTSSNGGIASIDLSTGVVTGRLASTATITYMLGTSCYLTKSITVNAFSPSYAAVRAVMEGSTITIGNALSGGVWSSSTTGVATVNATTGVVTGVSAGTSSISYTMPSGCTDYINITVISAPAPISGPSILCTGQSVTLTSTSTGGVWTSSNGGIALVDASTGVVTGRLASTVTITYTLAGAYSVRTMTVSTFSPSYTTTYSVMSGNTLTMVNPNSGGLWSSTNPGVASVDNTSGIVTGVGAGTTVISYTLPSGCSDGREITVIPVPSAITGPSVVCLSQTTTLTSATPGGIWTTSNGGIATVGSTTGIVTGLTVASVNITYTVGLGYAVKTLTVSTFSPVFASVTTINAGSTTTIFDTTTGGVWSSSAPAVATVNSTTGLVTGVLSGTTTISYTMPSGCTDGLMVTVTPAPSIGTGPGTVCVGNTLTLTHPTAGGVWTSSNGGIALVGSTTGIVSGRIASTCTITYTLPTSVIYTTTITVLPLATISGQTKLCNGQSMTLTNSISGGSWYSSNSGVIAVGSSSGIVSGISMGTSIITYVLPTGCYSLKTVTVLATMTGITGTTEICVGSTVTLGNPTTGGAWTSSNTAIATAGLYTGVVAGVSSGTSTITYAVGPGCRAYTTFTIDPVPAAISGGNSVCLSTPITLTNGTLGGVWSSLDETIATVGSSDGIVTGVTSGFTTTISYTLPGTGCYAVNSVAVNPCRMAGEEEVTKVSAFSLIPNPNSGTFTLKGRYAAATREEEVSIEVVNTLGQSVYRSTIKVEQGRINEQVTLPGTLANGMYLLNLRSDSNTKVLHFVMNK